MAWREQKQRKSNYPSRSRTRNGGIIKECSVFVYNLPQNLDQYGLKGIFQKAGKVSDAYIPRRGSRRTATRYGFVRFKSREDVIKSVSMLNNAVIRKRRIQVSMARYEK